MRARLHDALDAGLVESAIQIKLQAAYNSGSPYFYSQLPDPGFFFQYGVEIGGIYFEIKFILATVVKGFYIFSTGQKFCL
jgi:hypothetical protein